MNTKTGGIEKDETFDHAGGTRTVLSPDYSEDIALRVMRQRPRESVPREAPSELAEFFSPPEKFRSDYGAFGSPLLFTDGTMARTPADWQRRRSQIVATWHKIMGPWPPLLDKPRVEVVSTSFRENITQQQLRVQIALGGEMVDALLLVPAG